MGCSQWIKSCMQSVLGCCPKKQVQFLAGRVILLGVLSVRSLESSYSSSVLIKKTQLESDTQFGAPCLKLLTEREESTQERIARTIVLANVAYIE